MPDSIKIPYEYGFKERRGPVQLKGGKPAKVKVKKEKTIINLGGGGAGKLKKELVKTDEDIIPSSQPDDSAQAAVKDEVKKEVHKVSLDEILQSKTAEPVKSEVQDTAAEPAVVAAPKLSF